MGRAALFDTSAAVHGVTGLQALPAPLAITSSVTHYEAGRADMELSAPAPAGSALVVSENYYPGWRATVDGRSAAVGRVDYTLIGIELPAGARKVSLVFDSPEYRTGKTVTLAAIATALLLLIAGGFAERRRIA